MTEHKQVYLQFFAQLTSDLKEVVKTKLKEASQQERERLELLAEETDSELISILESQKEQILGNVWLFGKAFLLMLKKIDLISEGIEKITTDQDAQRELLLEMVGKLGKYKKVYALQRKITQSGKEAEKMAETAVNLEQYLQPFIGSFQGLIDQVCKQDNSLSGTVNEIQSLVEDIMSSNTGSFMSARADDLSKNMLDFLVTNEQKKERLVTAVEDAQREGIDWSWQQIDIQDCGDLTQAISALQAHIDGKLGEYSQEIEITPFSFRKLSNAPPTVNLGELQKGRIKLKSEKNIDYQSLEFLLSQGKWKEADEKTADLMLQAMGKSSWSDVDKNDLLIFPRTDLRTMDQLWLKYSDGKFGFSVQKQIWLDCGGKVGDNNYDVYCKFVEKVGWRNKRNSNYSPINYFTTNPTVGHLPAVIRGFGGKGRTNGFISLFFDTHYSIQRDQGF